MNQCFDLQAAIALKPHPTAHVCGDHAGAWQLGDNRLLVALADGLGHGEAAHADALACIKQVNASRFQPLTQIFADCASGLKLARGAALSIACIDPKREQITVGGVGNISTLLVGDSTQRFTNTEGIVGLPLAAPLLVQTASFIPATDCLFMSSDGIEESDAFFRFRPSLFSSLQTLADMLLAQTAKGTDDAGLVVVA